jgi:hypothetical protein
MKWGTDNFEEDEDDRPEFEGTPAKSPVDGSDYAYFSP